MIKSKKAIPDTFFANQELADMLPFKQCSVEIFAIPDDETQFFVGRNETINFEIAMRDEDILQKKWGI